MEYFIVVSRVKFIKLQNTIFDHKFPAEEGSRRNLNLTISISAEKGGLNRELKMKSSIIELRGPIISARQSHLLLNTK